MKVVVAGGTGLIGRRLVAALAEAGHESLVLSRGGDPATPRARVERWDGRSSSGPWVAELANADAVINLAGAGIGDRRWSSQRKELIVSSRVEPTTALSDAIGALPAAERPRVLINSSGTGYFGNSGEQSVDEESPPGADFLSAVCVAWEEAAEQASRHDVRVVRLRAPLVLAAEAKAVRLMVLPFRLFVGGRLGSGRQWFPWIHIEDLVGVILHAIENDELVGAVNAVAPDVRRQKDVAHEIGRAMKRPAAMPTPAAALRLALGEMADVLLHGQRAESRLLDGFDFRYPELESGLNEALR